VNGEHLSIVTSPDILNLFIYCCNIYQTASSCDTGPFRAWVRVWHDGVIIRTSETFDHTIAVATMGKLCTHCTFVTNQYKFTLLAKMRWCLVVGRSSSSHCACVRLTNRD